MWNLGVIIPVLVTLCIFLISNGSFSQLEQTFFLVFVSLFHFLVRFAETSGNSGGM